MAGSIVVSTSEVTHNLLRYRVAWTSDASGDVNGNTFTMSVGTIFAVEFLPGAGADAPTALHDADLLDANSMSLFDDGSGTSIGANLSATDGVHKIPLVGLITVSVYRRWFHGGEVQLTVTGAGDSNKGIVDIYVQPGVL